MRLNQVVANVLRIDVGRVNDGTCARNTPEWDSLRHIEVMMAIEMAFDVHFTLAEMTTVRTLGDVRQLLAQRGVKADRLRLEAA